MTKKQFKGTYQKRQSFDRRVLTVGNSRTVALTKVIPDDWKYVRVTPLNRTPKSVEILVELLLTRDEDAQIEANDKEGE